MRTLVCVFAAICFGLFGSDDARGKCNSSDKGKKFWIGNHKNKPMESLHFFFDGAAGFRISKVTQGDLVAAPTSATVTIMNQAASAIAEVWFQGFSLNKGEVLGPFYIHYTGVCQGSRRPKGDWKKPPKVKKDGGGVDEPFEDILIDEDVIFGGSTGDTHLGVAIPAGTYGYFYQVNNDTVGENVAGLTLDMSAANIPFTVDTLGFPHNGMRADPDMYRALPDDPDFPPLDPARGAVFEDLGVVSGVAPASWQFDPVQDKMVLHFNPPLAPGEQSNVFYMLADEGMDFARLSFFASTLTLGSGDHPAMLLVPGSVAVPTLGLWGLVLLAAGLVASRFLYLRSRRGRPAGV